MMIVRAAREADARGLYELARKAGPGLTTLPAHLPALEAKIADSLEAFGTPGTVTEKRSYLLVLEDLETGALAGTSAIVAGIGLDRPFYTYRMLHHTQVSQQPVKRVDTQLLQLSNDFTGASEVATLFLDADYRKGHLGKLLSKARYLLMASHPERFDHRVIAEIRGWVDEDGHSPFWDAIGRHFFDMDFAEADEINGRGNFHFIADLMPKFPIYTSLLPDSAQEVIGKPHDMSVAAKKMLEREGFIFSGAVDIFDGGPAMEVHRRGIWTVRRSKGDRLAGTVEGDGHDQDHLIANPDIANFRVCLGNVVETDSGIWLAESAAQALELSDGKAIHYAPIERAPTDISEKDLIQSKERSL